jgi:RNA polymerase sigma factor (sigma-70 family)
VAVERDRVAEDALVRRAQGGDADAREAVARAWLPVVYGVAVAVLRRAADAEDAAQEAFLRAFASLRSLRDPARFGPWILSIARNAARDHLRKRPSTSLETDPAARALPASDESAEAWQRLPEDERLVTWLKVSEGKTFREIAHLLATSKSAVDRTWRRALERLRKESQRC